jgi:hypothetical protein
MILKGFVNQLSVQVGHLEHDRAEMFYIIFFQKLLLLEKDLLKKSFGFLVRKKTLFVIKHTQNIVFRERTVKSWNV